MRGRPLVRAIRLGDVKAFRLLLLAAVFALGALFGCRGAAAFAAADGQALSGFLTDCRDVWAADGAGLSAGSCVLLYGSYTAAAFCLGFVGIGVVLIPLLAGCFGYLSMFTVACFAQVFGRDGVVLAAAVLLVRLVFTMPCFFAAACAAWPMAAELALPVRGRRAAAGASSGRSALLFVLCVAVLAAGVCCERLVTPQLVRMALAAE